MHCLRTWTAKIYDMLKAVKKDILTENEANDRVYRDCQCGSYVVGWFAFEDPGDHYNNLLNRVFGEMGHLRETDKLVVH